MTYPDAAILQALKKLIVPSSGIAGIGVDLVDVGVMKGLMESGQKPFLDTGWTSGERRETEGEPERLAARWAAKEAVMKALGRGLGDVDPLDIEITRGSNGAPVVLLRDRAAEAAELAGVERVHISMSHEQGWAVAFAVAVPRSYASAAIEQVGLDQGEHDDK